MIVYVSGRLLGCLCVFETVLFLTLTDYAQIIYVHSDGSLYEFSFKYFVCPMEICTPFGHMLHRRINTL